MKKLNTEEIKQIADDLFTMGLFDFLKKDKKEVNGEINHHEEIISSDKPPVAESSPVSVIKPNPLKRVKSVYDINRIYNRLPEAGLVLWGKKNISEDMICEMDENSLSLFITDSKTSDRRKIHIKDMECEIEELLRNEYPQDIPVGKIIYFNFGLNEPVIYEDACSFYRGVERAEDDGDPFKVVLYSVKGKTICSDRFDNNIVEDEVVYYEHIRGYEVQEYEGLNEYYISEIELSEKTKTKKDIERD